MKKQIILVVGAIGMLAALLAFAHHTDLVSVVKRLHGM